MPTPEMTEADKIEMKTVDFVAEWNKRYGSDPKLGFDLSTFVGVMSPENGAKEKLKLSQLKEALDLRLRLNKVSDSQRKLLINSFIASQSKR